MAYYEQDRSETNREENRKLNIQLARIIRADPKAVVRVYVESPDKCESINSSLRNSLQVTNSIPNHMVAFHTERDRPAVLVIRLNTIDDIIQV